MNLDYLKLVANEGIVKPTVNHNTLRAWYNNKMDEIESGDLPIEERQKQRNVLDKLFEAYTRTKPTLRKV